MENETSPKDSELGEPQYAMSSSAVMNWVDSMMINLN